jgi:hypothetical protein
LRAKRLISLALATFAVLGVLALPAVAAVKLPIQTAADKSFIFAKHTCAHDSQCVKYGVTNCRRISLHVVFCRIFDERSTEAQGRYDCQKLVRVALNPINFAVQVTGQGDWQC